MTKEEAEKEVAFRHGRSIYMAPVPPSLICGWSIFVMLYVLNGIELAVISGWVQLGVGVVSGVACYFYLERQNRQMRAEVKRLMEHDLSTPS